MQNIIEASDTARQAATAMLHDHDMEVVQLIREAANPELVAVTLCQLVTHVHTAWALAAGSTRDQRNNAWAAMMQAIEDDVSGHRRKV